MCCPWWQCHKTNLHTIKELQQEILAAVISISEETLAALISFSEETLAAVVRNFQHWLQMVLDTNGAYIENVFT
jgi:hypothetical protein